MAKSSAVTVFFFLLCSYLYAGDNTIKGEDKNETGQMNPVLSFYQKHISPADGSRCPMYPSCSHYAAQAFKKHGFVMGWIMSCDRLVRCGRDESKLAGRVVIEGHELIYDPVRSNDFWWSEKDEK